MADTTFTSGTVIASSWLNDVNDHVYLLNEFVELEKYRDLVTQVGGEDRWDAAFAAALSESISTKKPLYLGSNPVVKYFTTTWNLTAADTSRDGYTIS